MLIEDSCAAIIRHARFDFNSRKFHGKFADVRKDNPAVILTEGYYNTDGKKEGSFTIRYSSGNIKAKGNFKNDDFDGKWDLYYDGGKPMLTFEVNDGVYTITDAWDDKGRKTVDKGNGNYSVEIAQIYVWEGKLVNGKPDGTWKMYRNADKYKNIIGSERFKKGEFTKGDNQFGSYSDASRIQLLDKDLFPFMNAEKFLVGLPCNIPSRRTLVNAHYKNGMDSFNARLGSELTAFFNGNHREGKDGHFEIVGEISTQGDIEKLVRKGGSNVEIIASGIMRIITDLPRLIPATIDGKPVTQRFKLDLDLGTSSYSYSFQFLPILDR